MNKKNNFKKLLELYQKRVNGALNSFMQKLPFQDSKLVNAMKYGIFSNGKRLRPFLVYTIGEMFQSNNSSLDAPAAAVECIHAYSLIHDDLPTMDNSLLRRGQPTCHIKFGESLAILAGDALQTLAFSILSETPMPQIEMKNRLAMIKELAYASGVGGMCSGQAFDLIESGENISIEKLKIIHYHKTGALIHAAVKLGALTCSSFINNKTLINSALDNYAKSIGLAFQIQDDILDVIGETKIMGKKTGSDESLKKNTFPSLLGGVENARREAYKLYEQSMEALQILSNCSLNTKSLEALTNYIIKRDK
ncbi:MAG: (2E,6E)-farnesyl diphosphate synthase [Candidatus Dasytiphilus stammeri]